MDAASWIILLGVGTAAGIAGWQAIRAQRLSAALREANERVAARDAALAVARTDNAGLAAETDRLTLVAQEREDLLGENQRLLEAGRQAAQLLDAAPFPIWRRAPDGSLLWVNRRYAEMTEATPADVVARGIELASAHDLDRPRGLAREAREAGHLMAEDRRFVAEGDRRNYRVFEVPLPDGFLGFAQDITQEADARGQLRRHMEAHLEVLRTISTATAIYGQDKRLVLWNRAYARLWQLDETWLEQRPTFGEVLEQLRAARRLPEQIDWQVYKRTQLSLFTTVIERQEELMHLPDGSTLRLVISAYPSGGLFFAYDDVTRQLTLERATNTLIAVQRATLDNLYEAVVVYGPDGRLSLYNRAFSQLWQLEPEILNRQPHITEVLEATRPLMQRGNDWTIWREHAMDGFAARRTNHGRLERGDGKVIEHASVPLPDGAMLYTYLDVTDSIRIERALRDRNEALERTDRMNAAFIANITHELRSPLGTLISMTEVLSQGILGPVNARQAEYGRDIMQASRHLLRLLDDIIVIAAIEVGQLALEPERFAIVSIWADDAAHWHDTAEHRGVTLELPRDEQDYACRGDAQRLRQALGSVMAAALNGTPQDGRVRLDIRQDQGILLLCIESHSGGRAPLGPPRLFTDLTAGADRRQANADLSLLVARGLIELHGGSVALNNQHPDGADGTLQSALIRLPILATDIAAATQPH